MEMHATEQTPKQLLTGDPQFAIPLYQRTFAWQREQVQLLWDDIAEQVEALDEATPGAGHFLGSVVLAPTTQAVGEVTRWVVVDGQQRLTTLSLALAALRDHIRPEAPRDADRIHRQFLVNEYQEGPGHFKIMPTQADRSDYELVIEGNGSEARGNIGEVYRVFRELLVGRYSPGQSARWRSLEQAITERLDLVAITADNTDNVHRIFQSLNNTGMSLTQGDLLRNYIFMLLPTTGDEVYRRVWHPMERRIGASNLETLAFLDLVTQGYEKANRGDTYRLQTERLARYAHSETDVAADLERLALRAEYVAQVLDPTKVADPGVRAALQRLGAWGGESTWPVMLVALERYGNDTTSREQLLNTADCLESYLVRRMIAGRSAAGINRILIQASNTIAGENDIATALRIYLSAPRRYWPTDSQLLEAADTRNFYWSGKPAQRLFVLRRIEESYGHKESIDWATVRPSIEHIMPQSPGPEWLEGLHDAEDPDAEPRDVHQAFVHRLGNLTLTGYNSDLSNAVFDQKRLTYLQSNFAMTRSVGEAGAWGPELIRERGRDLAKRATHIWPGPADVGLPAEDDRWTIVRQLLVALPEGVWTTYGDVAAVTGRAPMPLGNYLASNTVPNAWRVLNAGGRVAANFRWADGREADPIDVLTSEGVRFASSVADPEQRLGPTELAALLGIEVPDDNPFQDAEEDPALAQRFRLQLLAAQSPEVVSAVDDLIGHWVGLGGTLGYGSSAQTSLFFMYRHSDPQVWPWALYPLQRGSLEVVFQHLKTRAPFTDTALREELRQRLNTVPGIWIDPVKIGLRPSVPLTTLANPAAIKGLRDVADWFVWTVQRGGASEEAEGPPE